ncbi:MAG: alginate export family protein [Pseudomonadota bacterium]|nr:alginate export family protein [Pseudomonadota bacterium]
MLRQLKGLGLVAAATAVFGLVSIASAEVNFESSGGMKWRGEEYSDTFTNAGLDSRSTDFSSMSINWDLKFMPDPKVMVFFQPKFVKNLGDDPAGSKGAATNGDGYNDSGLDVHQGYLTYKAHDRASVTVGRYEMNYGDEYLIGSDSWTFTGRAFDGWKVNYKWSKGWLDAFYNKIKDKDAGHAGAVGVNGDDSDFYGLYHSMALGSTVSAFDLYYLVKSDRTTQTTPGPTALVNTTGLRVKGGKGAVDFTAEYNTQSGETNAGAVTTDLEDAGSMRANVGFTFKQNWRLGLEYAASDRNYDQLFPSGSNWLGDISLFSRRNITDTAVSISGTMMEHMTVNATYHMLSRTEDGADKNGAFTSVYDFGGVAYGAAAAGNDSAVGNELDLNVTCSKMKALAWTLGYSQFSAGDYLTSTTAGLSAADQDDKKMSSISWVYLQAVAKF